MPETPTALKDLLRAQHGLVSLEQCRSLGVSPGRRRHLVRSGRWQQVAPRVYSVADHRETWVRSLWISHLHGGEDSVISHESAGRLHRFAQVPAGRVALFVTANRRHGPPGVRHHRAGDLQPSHVTLWNGLPVTTALRTVFDLASVLHVASLRLLVEDSVTDHRFTVAQLGAFLDGLRRRGKPGVARLARVLDDLGPGDGLPHSELERLLDRVIELSGLPTPVHEYPLPGRGAVTGFVDRCWPEVGLIVEGDGRKWHTRRQQALRDSTRSLEAQAVGFDTTRLLWEHLANDPDGTASLLRSVYTQRRAMLDHRSS